MIPIMNGLSQDKTPTLQEKGIVLQTFLALPFLAGNFPNFEGVCGVFTLHTPSKFGAIPLIVEPHFSRGLKSR